jgi:sortase A
VKAMRYMTALILLAGGCLTGRAAYLHAKAELAGVLIRRAWDQSAHSGEPHAPWPWADTHPVARLRISRLGFDEIVLDAATPRALAFGPALLMSGAEPGRPGNVVLAGHRTSWFRPLEGIAKGDRIQIAWFDRRRMGLYERTYTVNLVQVVEPPLRKTPSRSSRVTRSEAARALRFVTWCGPHRSGQADRRRMQV